MPTAPPALSDPAPFRHADFLTANRMPDVDRDGAVAVGAYLVVRLVGQALRAPAPDVAFVEEVDATRRFVRTLPSHLDEVRHLQRVGDWLLDRDRAAGSAVVRRSLVPYLDFLEHEGRLPEALDLATTSADTLVSASAADVAATALRAGRLHRLLAAWPDAVAGYRQAMRAARLANDPVTRFRALLGLSGVARGQGRWDEAEALAQVVRDEARTLGLREVEAMAYQDLGAIAERRGHYREALAANERAYILTTEPARRLRIVGDSGAIQARLGTYAAAREALESVADGAGDRLLRANARVELMGVAAALGHRDAFERHRHLIMTERALPPSLAVDWRWKSGLGLMRFEAWSAAREAFRDAMALAARHSLRV